MSVFARHVDAAVAALHWKRTIVVEEGKWRSGRTVWKPYGDNVRNLRTVRDAEFEIANDNVLPAAARGLSSGKMHFVLANHTYFEFEEFEWRRYRSFVAEGESPEDVRWPQHALDPGQRISERREIYRATFSAETEGGKVKYVATLDEGTWRTLRTGLKCGLKIDAFSGKVHQVTPVPG